MQLREHDRLQGREIADEVLGGRALAAGEVGQAVCPLDVVRARRLGAGRERPGHLADQRRQLARDAARGYPLDVLERGPLEDPHQPQLRDLPPGVLEMRDRRIHSGLVRGNGEARSEPGGPFREQVPDCTPRTGCKIAPN